MPALPGCITEGDTFEEALANARDAIEGHVAALRKIGEEVPTEAPPPILASIKIAAAVPAVAPP